MPSNPSPRARQMVTDLIDDAPEVAALNLSVGDRDEIARRVDDELPAFDAILRETARCSPRLDNVLRETAGRSPRSRTRARSRRGAYRSYPANGADVIDDALRYKRGAVAAVRQFSRSRPYQGTHGERVAKFKALHRRLCEIYGKTTRVHFGASTTGNTTSGMSNYRCDNDTITLDGRLSVVTYLHEFAHALERDEHDACKWALNLFKREFPRSFARCTFDGHMLLAPSNRRQRRPRRQRSRRRANILY